MGERARRGAQSRLRHFRHATIISVAITGLLLILFSPSEAGVAQDAPDTVAADSALPDTVSIIRQVPLEELQAAASEEPATQAADSLAMQSTAEAQQTLRQLWLDFHAVLPKLGIALGILLLAWLLVRLVRPLLRRVLRSWTRAEAFTAVFGIVIWLLSVGVALSVLTGDIRALVGSLGLVGLALSWALQSPIESFTGWLLNAFRGYYRIGDRIAVGEVYGDVYRIDLLTTTVWEYGGPDRPGLLVRGEQPTGRLITFPNSEILTGSVVNTTRDFAYVWDELSLNFATHSDVPYLLETMRRVAQEVLGEYMAAPARHYAQVLREHGLEPWVAEEPQVYLAITADGWLEATIRYLVAARERRVWKSKLVERVMTELQKPEAKERIASAVPRQQLQFLDEQGELDTPWA